MKKKKEVTFAIQDLKVNFSTKIKEFRTLNGKTSNNFLFSKRYGNFI